MGDDSAMNLELHSERLALTPVAPTDLDLCLEMFTDPEVAEYVGGPMTKAAISNEMSNWTKRGGDGCIGIWCISDLGNGEKYGSAALLPMPVEEDDTDFSLVTPGKMPEGDVEIGYLRPPALRYPASTATTQVSALQTSRTMASTRGTGHPTKT